MGQTATLRVVEPARPLLDLSERDSARLHALSERDEAILAFERKWWRYAGAKEQAIRDLFDLSATRYYQRLNALIDTEAALAADPILVKRLRRQREGRHRERAARRIPHPPH